MLTLLLFFAVLHTSQTFFIDSLLHPPKVVSELDLQKYLGRWYQMYSSQSVYATFERGAFCVTADYTLNSTGKINVLNSERLNSATGPLKVIHGYATPTQTVGKLTVHLETVIFDAPYWVIKLGPATFGSENKYQYAVVSDNIKATLFVLARDPDVFQKNYEAEILQFLTEQGFTSIVDKPVKTYQKADCLYSDQHV